MIENQHNYGSMYASIHRDPYLLRLFLCSVTALPRLLAQLQDERYLALVVLRSCKRSVHLTIKIGLWSTGSSHSRKDLTRSRGGNPSPFTHPPSIPDSTNFPRTRPHRLNKVDHYHLHPLPTQASTQKEAADYLWA